MGNHWLPMVTSMDGSAEVVVPMLAFAHRFLMMLQAISMGEGVKGWCPGWHGGHGGHGYWWLTWLLAIGYGPATSRGINVAVRNRFWRTSIMGWVIVPRISRFDHGTYVNVYTRISYILYHICTYVCVYICNHIQQLCWLTLKQPRWSLAKLSVVLFLLVQNCPQCKASEVTLLQQPIIRSDLFKT